jgi:FMN reductase
VTTATADAAVGAPEAGSGGAALRVVVVNGSPSEQSKTMGLVDAVFGTLEEIMPFERSQVDVYRLGPGFSGAVERGDVTPDVEAAIRMAEQADLLIAATGGGEHHALALEHGLRPLFGFFQAMTIPVAIFASSGDFDGTLLLNPRVYGRIEMSLRDVADLLRMRATGVSRSP